MFLEGSGELAHLRLIKTWLGGICGANTTEGAPAPEVLLTSASNLLFLPLTIIIPHI